MKDKLKVIIFALVLLSAPLRTLLLPQQTTSYFENRSLAAFPQCSRESLFSREYFSALEDYISDHLPERDQLLSLHTSIALGARSPVVNDVVVTEQCLLPYHGTALPQYDADKLREEVSLLDALNKHCRAQGIRLLYVGVPEQSSALRDAYPAYLLPSVYQHNTMSADFFAALSAHGIEHLDLRDTLSADFARYYSKTDHHYNLLGAYETYLQIMECLNGSGFAAPVLTELTFSKVDAPFLGSRNRKLFGLYQSDDALYTYQAAEDVPFTRCDNGAPVESTVFDETQRNVYNYYMGGDKAETIIRTDRPSLPDALIVGDSFTNALETFAYRSFDETRSLDFRHYTEKTIYEYLEDYHPDVLLIVRDDLSFAITEGNGGLRAS